MNSHDQNSYSSYTLTIARNLIHDAIKENREVLDLSAIGLTQLPDELESIGRKLYFLDLAHNQINLEGIKRIAACCPHLMALNLKANALDDDCAKELTKLVNLTRLDISINEIGSKGIDEIIKLTKLTHLHLSYTRITDDDISKLLFLKHLTDLDLSRNGITNTGALQITKFKNLSNINISSNFIDFEGLKSIANSRYFKNVTGIFDRKVTDGIPYEVLSSFSSIRAYTEAIAITGPVSGNVIRIVLCGNTNAGKTSLAGKLTNENRLNPHTENRTHGIQHWQIKKRRIDRSNYTLNIWDFGGQDYYHGTHAAALSAIEKEKANEHSIYLLLWRKNKPSENKDNPGSNYASQQMNEDYWLGFIQLLAHRSTLKIIQTHIDLDGVHNLASQLLPHLNIISNKDCYNICLDDENIKSGNFKKEWSRFNEDLDEMITQIAQKAQIPKLYQIIRENELSKLSGKNTQKPRPVWKRKELLAALANRPAIKKLLQTAKYTPDYEEIIKYISRCGELLYWENAAAILNEHVVIDIQQFHKELYEKILPPHLIGIGEFEWNEEYAFHINYLHHNDLIFKKDGDNNLWIVPQYLPPEPNQIKRFEEHTPVILVLKYPYYMPRFIITRFIVQTFRQGQDSYCWKYGIISKIDNTDIKVRMDIEKQEVYIHIEKTKENAFTLTRKIFLYFASFGEKAAWDNDNINSPSYEEILISPEGRHFITYKNCKKYVREGDMKAWDINDNSFIITPVMQFITGNKTLFRKKIFISYSHKDRAWLDKIKTLLNALKNLGHNIISFDDENIETGDDWRKEIDNAIAETKVAVLLVSNYFFASDFIQHEELPALLAAASRNELSIMPIIISPCFYNKHPALKNIQSVNPPGKSLMELEVSLQERYLMKLAEKVAQKIPDNPPV